MAAPFACPARLRMAAATSSTVARRYRPSSPHHGPRSFRSTEHVGAPAGPRPPAARQLVFNDDCLSHIAPKGQSWVSPLVPEEVR